MQEGYRANHRKPYIDFVDVKRAFDVVSHIVIELTKGQINILKNRLELQ